MFYKIDALENFAKFTGKHLCWSYFFDKIASLDRLLCKCFPMTFVKFSGTFFIEDLKQLLLDCSPKITFAIDPRVWGGL